MKMKSEPVVISTPYRHDSIFEKLFHIEPKDTPFTAILGGVPMCSAHHTYYCLACGVGFRPAEPPYAFVWQEPERQVEFWPVVEAPRPGGIIKGITA